MVPPALPCAALDSSFPFYYIVLKKPQGLSTDRKNGGIPCR
jgi:hypothetical protein